jgi:opacity protein-like surface antigen
LAIVWIAVVAPTVCAQRGIEVTPFFGGQANGGMDLSTRVFDRIEVRNGLNHGISAGYLLGNYGGVEFTWNHNKSDTVAQLTGAGVDQKVFELGTNQYLGNFVLHLKDRESRFRPFVLMGLGAAHLAPDRKGAGGITRFAWAFGGGVKYNFSKRIGVRFQAKTSPTYIASTTEGFWCDPYWGGCWAIGQTYFLQEFDATVGLTFRF